MTTTWKYTDATQLVVYRTLTNGSMQSCSVEATNYLKWVADGNTATAADAIPDPTYQENRVAEYPPIGDQLDLLYKDMLADKGDKTGAWFTAVKTVKDKYPKP
jgi:hypothetical protein